MFKKILIANRGEIAVRVAHTLQLMGIRTLSVYSDADHNALHALCTDEAYPLEGVTAADTYLRGDRIIEIARGHGVDAIHPGYGFLSENASFAQSCADAGITFIGPSPDVIRTLGDKLVAKEIMKQAGVPVVPGWSSEHPSIDDLKTHAGEIGYPVLIKAAAGGGGKGMRIVACESELASSVEAARRESGSAFGDDRIFLEKYIERPRHVEVQVFGDHQGHVCHLFERECSIQRRHQKIVEETPSPALTPELRGRMGEAAVRAAKASGYANAGTVEFLLDSTGAFYFLEVNARLQVEHPVTEMTTGIDLVRLQIEVAAGQSLLFEQADLGQCGHAIECRIYAEDSAAGFLPSTGTIRRFHAPIAPDIRVDSGVQSGSEVTVHYDPMLAKLVCWADSRRSAIEKALWSLDRFVVMGVESNVPFLRSLLTHPAFRTGDLHTQFLDEHSIALESGRDEDALIAAAIACGLGFAGRRYPTHDLARQRDRQTPWRSVGGWRLAT